LAPPLSLFPLSLPFRIRAARLPLPSGKCKSVLPYHLIPPPFFFRRENWQADSPPWFPYPTVFCLWVVGGGGSFPTLPMNETSCFLSFFPLALQSFFPLPCMKDNGETSLVSFMEAPPFVPLLLLLRSILFPLPPSVSPLSEVLHIIHFWKPWKRAPPLFLSSPSRSLSPPVGGMGATSSDG